MKQKIKQTEQLYLVEQVVTRVALVKASDVQKVEEVADSLDADKWVEKATPYSIRDVQKVPFLHAWVREEQPHIRVQYDIASRNMLVINVEPGIEDPSPTFHEAYLPYDLVREYGLPDAFLLWVRVDHRHIVRVGNQYYTRDGSRYPECEMEALLPPEELVHGG
jgi:hypothetical protein